jgi:hypothetical protein
MNWSIAAIAAGCCGESEIRTGNDPGSYLDSRLLDRAGRVRGFHGGLSNQVEGLILGSCAVDLEMSSTRHYKRVG